MRTKRQKYFVIIMQILLPVVPGLYVMLFRPEITLLVPRVIIPWMLGVNMLFILMCRRKLGWTRKERRRTSWQLVAFSFFPWLGYMMLSVLGVTWPLWLQVAFYCALQAELYLATDQAPYWLSRLLQNRYETRVLTGKETFESRSRLLESRREKIRDQQ